MSSPWPDLAATRPPQTLRIGQPTLAATVPTAMLLVDYALNQNSLPDAEVTALAESLPADLVSASWPIRASMAHGAVLRAVLLHQLPVGHPGHRDWPALRGWIAGWTDAFVNGVIDFGCDSVMHYQQRRDPEPTAAEIAPRSTPSTAVRRDGPEVLRAWAIPDPDERAAELLDPRGFRHTLLDLLDAIWDGWLGEAWHATLPDLLSAAAPAPTPPGCSAEQWITLVTGLRPDPSYAEIADHARDVVVMPTVGLGRSLSLFADQQTWVLFSPQHQPDRSPNNATGRTGISLGNLGQLAPALTALGDKTRLAIVLQLLDRGPLSMQQLTDALEVHQSTISRQVTVLRRSGLVEVDGDRRVAVQRPAIRHAAETLLATLD
ncbi:ArsR/SmtB family transcription factor [Microlunatus soli]|nr:helix-turn-helix domain-containing protein [Microlunatus soli]